MGSQISLKYIALEFTYPLLNFIINNMKKILVLGIGCFLLFGFQSANAGVSFDKDLYFGMKANPDVSNLQSFLTERKIYSGPITGNFFSMTQNAVRQFQINENITPALGYFGPLSRAKANSLIARQNQQQNQSGESAAVSVSSLYAELNSLMAQLQTLQNKPQSTAVSQPAVAAASTSSIPLATSSQPVITVTAPASATVSSGISVTPLGQNISRAKNTIDDVAKITFAVSNTGGAISLNQIILTIAGSLPTASFTSTGSAADDIKLIDSSTGAPASGTVTNSACSSGGTCAFTFSFASPVTSATNGYVIVPGTSKTFIVRVNSLAHVLAPSSGQSATLGISINSPADVTYVDALDGTGVAINLPANAVPVSVNSVSYSSGT